MVATITADAIGGVPRAAFHSAGAGLRERPALRDRTRLIVNAAPAKFATIKTAAIPRTR